MKLTLLGWESCGLRCPDMSIDLTQNGKVPKVSLVQMPNGTGKTTTLDLIMAALNGEAKNWPSSKIRQFRRAGGTNDHGKFVLKLLTDDDPLTFELAFDFLEDRVIYRTTAKSNGGVREDWQPPLEVRRFLKDRFVRLFIFNGELAQDLLDARQTEASKAIDTLCQLEDLDKIIEAAKADWQLATRNQGAKTAAGLTSWQGKEKRLASRLTEIQSLRAGLLAEKDATEEKVRDLSDQLARNLQYDHETQARKEELEEKIRAHEAKLKDMTRHILQLIRQPQYLSPHFAGGLATLKDQFDRVRLPESTSRQFFIELADEPLCVCGRPISEHERQSILGQAERYLANELYSFINNLKGDIKQCVLDEPEAPKTCIELAIAQIRSLRRELSEIRTELNEIQNDSIDSSGDSTKKLAADLTYQKGELEKIELSLNKIDDHPESDTSDDSWSIRGLEGELKRIRNTIAQITGTVELKERIDTIITVMDKTKQLAQNRLRDAIRTACNEKLNKVLSGDPIRIDQIHQSLSLQNQDGASVGQTLAVGYTFLTTLLGRAAHKFPLVVDSPAGPLDDHVRKQVGRMIPGLCDQFVAFTISTEREHFLPALEGTVGDSIAYITAFRASPGTKQMMENLPSNAACTQDGVVVSGRDYFVKFVIPEEQE